MKKCPRCLKYSVSYDGNIKGFKCLEDECGIIILEDGKSYYIIKQNLLSQKIEKVEVQIDNKTEKVIQEYEMF